MKWFVLAFLLFVPSAFSAQQGGNTHRIFSFLSGEGLRTRCLHYGSTETFANGDERDDVEYSTGFCAGFVTAAVAAVDMRYWEPPNGHLSEAQAVAVVRKYLEDHPEKWGSPAAGLVNNALIDAFPPSR